MKKGVLSAAAAYTLWGFFPIYFHALKTVPAAQVTANRVAWSFVFLVIALSIRKEFNAIRPAMNRRGLLIYLAAGAFLVVNWLTYIWAVNAGFVIEASLGYFINPLVNVVLGMAFFGERLRTAQWIPVGMAAAGVIYLAVAYGSLPWIALVLAFTFGIYGVLKKIAPLTSLPGLTLETGMIFLPALGYLAFSELSGAGALVHAGWTTTVLLALTGIITAVPLLLFSTAARNVPLTTMGLLQYICPTMQFLMGVFLYQEPFTVHQLIGFSIIWLGLIYFSAESFLSRRRVPVMEPGEA